MLSLRKPSPASITGFLRSQRETDVDSLPLQLVEKISRHRSGRDDEGGAAGFNFDETRRTLGQGRACFDRACAALRSWRHFDLGWMGAAPADTPIEIGRDVAILFHAGGLWWLNACRIVKVIDEPEKRFGFVYQTLPSHAEIGAERFLVQWNQGQSQGASGSNAASGGNAEGEVIYEIRAVSRPRHLLARIGYPYARHMQRWFARCSADAMAKAAAS